jgi:glycosyltransferase involved in cell wall biosynthesis
MPLAKSSGKKQINPATTRVSSIDQTASGRPGKSKSRQHPWKVVHACEAAREVLPLVEGQLAAGMRPFLLTPAGYGSARSFLDGGKRESKTPVSLLQTWNHVREWRRLLNESEADRSSEIVHAHSFASGMAAVRASSGVVYQLRRTVEKIAAAEGNCDEGSWLARSFRVAEQFVLLRAAAVVVSSHAERLACLERGVGAEYLFCIPDPIRSELLESVPDRNWLEQVAGGNSETVFFVVPGLPESPSWESRDSLLRWMRVLSILRQENADARFVLVAAEEAEPSVNQMAAACNLLPWVTVLRPEWCDRALGSADVVICDREHADSAVALETLARGRALLAGDVEQHRDITADGRGCLWFRPGEVGDIAQRARFLAENPQFRRALAMAGREHCLATRSAEVIASHYDAVYRLAFGKRKGRDSSPPKTQLIPLQVGG